MKQWWGQQEPSLGKSVHRGTWSLEKQGENMNQSGLVPGEPTGKHEPAVLGTLENRGENINQLDLLPGEAGAQHQPTVGKT